MNKRFSLLLGFFLVLSFGSCIPPGNVPPHVYLTWRHADTSTTMTVNFHTAAGTRHVWVHYDVASRSGVLSKYTFRVPASSRVITDLGRRIHAADLTGLSPGTRYFFVVSDGTTVLSEESAFQTIPKGDAPIRFVSGGDMGTGRAVNELQRQAAALKPMFALIGGDIAYANGNLGNYDKWDDWLSVWTKNMRHPDGTLIPLIVAVGNHDVAGGFFGSPEQAPFYLNYFAQEPSRSFFTRRFAGHTVVHVLDSNHLADIWGEQTAWLEQTLSETSDAVNRFALYHVPLYPSVRDDQEVGSRVARKYWLPLFDRFALTAAFENHDHALKRTKPLRHGKVAAGGTVYFGDGCWGRKSRSPDSKRWYLEHAEDARHFWYIEASPKKLKFQAIDRDGKVRDAHTMTR